MKKLFITSRHNRMLRCSLLIIGEAALLAAVAAGTTGFDSFLNFGRKSEGECLACFMNKQGKWGYLDEYGNEIIKCRYDYAADFGDDGYAVTGMDDESSENCYGLIDAEGNEIIPCQYWYVSDDLDNGRFIISWSQEGDDGRIAAGFAKADGTIILSDGLDIYQTVGDQGLYIASTLPGDGPPMYGIINDSCEWVIQPEYTYLELLETSKGDPLMVNGEYCIAASDETWSFGLIDPEGNCLLPFTYMEIRYDKSIDYLVVRDKQNHVDVLNTSLESICSNQVGYLSSFSRNGYAVANAGNASYMISLTGKPKDLGMYVTASCSDDTLFTVYAGVKQGVMDESGTWILQPEYDWIEISRNYIRSVNYENGMEALYDRRGQEIASTDTGSFYMPGDLGDDYYDSDEKAELENVIPVQGLDGLYAIDGSGSILTDQDYEGVTASFGWINLYNESEQKGILLDPEGKVISREYCHYHVDKESDYITAWGGKSRECVLLDRSGRFLRAFGGNQKNVGTFRKVR